MEGLTLIMPMAGRGSRFKTAGHREPKPLIDLHGRPFFAWAVDSVMAAAPVRRLVFVVLREHVEAFAIDTAIHNVYPQARVVVLDQETSGTAETAIRGLAEADAGVVAVNDCDHAFDARGLAATADRLRRGEAAGALLGFPADTPHFSYARLAADGTVAGTVEKEVVSPYAIAGCYLFAAQATLERHYAEYQRTCPYKETYLSGVYNTAIARGDRVLFQPLRRHVPFGTPEEMARVRTADLAFLRRGAA